MILLERIYINSAYAFFRQLSAGVPGAVGLFVNLGAWATDDCVAQYCRRKQQGRPRQIGLCEATALNMIGMIGVGPFITILH